MPTAELELGAESSFLPRILFCHLPYFNHHLLEQSPLKRLRDPKKQENIFKVFPKKKWAQKRRLFVLCVSSHTIIRRHQVTP